MGERFLPGLGQREYECDDTTKTGCRLLSDFVEALAAWVSLVIGIFAAAKMAPLSDDKTVAKMGHPIVAAR